MKKKQLKSTDTRIETRNAILAALTKAQGDSNSLDITLDEPDSDGNGYYILTREEITALLSGNMERIESWVGNLDRRHAIWLLRWLIKEST